MKDSLESQETRTGTTGFGRNSLKTGESPSKPRRALWQAAVTVKPPLPIEPVSERFPALEKQEIILTFFDPKAKEVIVAGNFNGWRMDGRPLKKAGVGEWVARLLLRSGQYEYRFIVDGRWIEDPRAGQRVANPYGSFNSVLLVPVPVRTSIL